MLPLQKDIAAPVFWNLAIYFRRDRRRFPSCRGPSQANCLHRAMIIKNELIAEVLYFKQLNAIFLLPRCKHMGGFRDGLAWFQDSRNFE